MTNNKLQVALSLCLFAAASAFAQTSPIRPAYLYPAPAANAGTGAAAVQVGESPVYASPYIGVGVGRDDNLFLSRDNPKSSPLYVVSPGLKLDSRGPGFVLQSHLQAQAGRYSDSRDDDYQDYYAYNSLDIALNRNNFVRLGFDFLRLHDPRGSTDRSVSAHPDKYQLISPNATYALGAPGAPGRIELYWTDAYKQYKNNRATTELADRDTRDLGAAFYWRVMPKTYAVLDVRDTNIKYRSPGNPFSSEEKRALVGVTWEATAATSGTFKVGRIQKDFESDIPNFSGTTWEGMVTWAPRTYSKFEFFTARTPNEATGLGDFILSDIYGLAWDHTWSSVWSTNVNLRHQKDAYQGFDRTDNWTMVGFKVGYKFRRWLILGAEYTHTTRNSNITNFEYDKNLYLLTATASM